jgi:malto-oligosyltrehalose synthase
MAGGRTVRATLRLQFHREFTFRNAEALVPYMAKLGISHLYASPIATARAGSMHGYDVIDPTTVNPELGGEDDLKRLAGALHDKGLGLIVDIVPNHMAAVIENRWWLDVLTHGRRSEFAESFDIDWGRNGKVFLPWLTQPRAEVRAEGISELAAKMGLPKDGAYELGWWRTAGDRINWRRFFDINELVCLRMEDPATFERVNALTFRLHDEGIIDGVRVDHVDGLADPATYCRALRRRLGPEAYVVVEKILLGDETLSAEWQCNGTTGYDFMDQVSALQHDSHAADSFNALWNELSGRAGTYDAEEQQARREILSRSFGGQLDRCVAAFGEAAPADSELGTPALRRVVTELLAHFPVYRSYASASERPASDLPVLRHAAESARRTGLSGDRWIVDRLVQWFADPAQPVEPLRRFQQLSAPIAAKSVEDTAFYRYGRLLSRNDVGFDVRRFGCGPAGWHRAMRERQRGLPRGMLATATHDHKRGEDVRARLAVLSERPAWWAAHLRHWLPLCEPLAAADAIMLLQTIVGAWPYGLHLEDRAGRRAFAERVAQWQEKALREAKLRSDWATPDIGYEQAARGFVLRLLDEGLPARLLSGLHRTVQTIEAAGAVNGLAQLLLKLTAPGVPDLYQGCEYWDQSLVDPDNRRPVDFDVRRTSLDYADVDAALEHWRDGRLKQAVLAGALALRRRHPDLFTDGRYEPVEVRGSAADHVVAFLRRQGDAALLVVVPRLPGALLQASDRLALSPAAWGDTRLCLPLLPRLHDVLRPEAEPIEPGNVAMQRTCGSLPVALFSTHVV